MPSLGSPRGYWLSGNACFSHRAMKAYLLCMQVVPKALLRIIGGNKTYSMSCAVFSNLQILREDSTAGVLRDWAYFYPQFRGSPVGGELVIRRPLGSEVGHRAPQIFAARRSQGASSQITRSRIFSKHRSFDIGQRGHRLRRNITS